MPDLTADLSADVRGEADRILDRLHAEGWRDIDSHGPYTPGTRVRHTGHQWPAAYNAGSGTVLAVTLKDPSSWSVVHNLPDVEIVVVWDAGAHLSRVSHVAQYHVEAVGVPS